VDIFAKNCDRSLAKFVAMSVESAMYNLFSKDEKGYTAKFRLLSANLKRNEASIPL
jgi:hypothetical protein